MLPTIADSAVDRGSRRRPKAEQPETIYWYQLFVRSGDGWTPSPLYRRSKSNLRKAAVTRCIDPADYIIERVLAPPRPTAAQCEGKLFLDDDARSRRAVRCLGCGGFSVPPCRVCWMRRYVARGSRYDHHDPDPARMDRPGFIPRSLHNDQVASILDALTVLYDDGLTMAITERIAKVAKTKPPIVRLIARELPRWRETEARLLAARARRQSTGQWPATDAG